MKLIIISIMLILFTGCSQSDELNVNIKKVEAVADAIIEKKEVKTNRWITNKKYDKYFMKEYRSQFYLYKSFYSWHIIKAQSIQESQLKPTAKSPVGARGLMQFMPRTEIGVAKDLKINVPNPALVPHLAIKMGVFYDYRIFKQWKSKRTLKSRYQLAFASYNAGLGNLLKAQKQCLKVQSNCNEYNDIEESLYKVTGHHSKETIGYNKRIFKYYYLIN